MNSPIKLFSLTLFLLALISCRSMKIEDLKPQPKNNNILPTLKVMVDISSLESAYTLGSSTSVSSGSNSTINTTNNNNSNRSNTIGVAVSNTVLSKDKRIQDVITIFDRDVKDNITDPFGEQKGYITCRINGAIHKTRVGLSVLSGMTLGIFNLFGMPAGSYQTTLDVDVEIFDNSEKLIARYNGVAKRKIYLAAYWGYGKDAERVANVQAFREAMIQIKNQINNDYQSLILKLN